MDVILDSGKVSRHHAELVKDPFDRWWVRDLGSRNGTFVAGVKVHDARVPAGATMRFGTTEIVVSYDPPAVPESGMCPLTLIRPV